MSFKHFFSRDGENWDVHIHNERVKKGLQYNIFSESECNEMKIFPIQNPKLFGCW